MGGKKKRKIKNKIKKIKKKRNKKKRKKRKKNFNETNSVSLSERLMSKWVPLSSCILRGCMGCQPGFIISKHGLED